MKLLFLSRWYPFPADNGARLRVFNLIKALSREHEISLVSFTSEPADEARIAQMRAWCARVQTAPYTSFAPDSIKSRLGALSWKPRSVVGTDSAEMHALAHAEVGQFKPDLVIASQIDMIPYAQMLPVRKLIEELEVGVIRQALENARGMRRARAWLTWQKLKYYVRHIAPAFHGCTVVSENEMRWVQHMTDALPLAVMPNGVDVAACNAVRATPARDTLIYNGSVTYGPNLDAVQHFVEAIFPLVLRERPAARLFVTGRTDGVPADQLPQHDHLTWTGYVDDIRRVVAGSWVAVAPIRKGGGTRLKILEALALRTPVVSTAKGAEGLGLVDGCDAFIADEPVAFAQRVVRVLSDAQVRRDMAERGAQTAAARFDWQVIGRRLSQFVRQVAAPERISTQSTMRSGREEK